MKLLRKKKKIATNLLGVDDCCLIDLSFYKGYNIFTSRDNVMYHSNPIMCVRDLSAVTFISKKNEVREMTIAEIEKELGMNNLRIVKERPRMQFVTIGTRT